MPYKNLTESPEKANLRIANYESSPASAQSFQGGLQPISQLQRTLGNRNVAKLIQAKQLTQEGKIVGLQPKLTVGAADDQYEQEADRVARQVMSTPDAVAANSMQRAMSPEEDKDKMLQTKPLAASITPFVQRQMVNNEEPEDKEKPVQAKFSTETSSSEPLQRQSEEDKDKKDKMLQTKPLAASITPFMQRQMVNNEEPEDKEKPVQAKFSTETNREPLQRLPEADEEEKEPIQAKFVSTQGAISSEEDKDKMLQTKPLAASMTPFMQRQMVNNGESEDKEKPVQAKFSTEMGRKPLQRQPEADEKEKEPIQAKSAGSISDSIDAGDDIETQVNQNKGRGSPLPEPVRAYMEPRFGIDFSHVRVHTGSDAIHMNRDIGAQAFTHGSDIYYGAGHAPTNLELTAHELTHTVQQGAVSSGHLGAKLMIQKADGDKSTTAFGEFEAVKYHPLKQKSDSKEVGVEMFLKFKPGPNVDAKQIALTQAATGKIGGTSAAAVPNYGRRSATSGAGQGYFVDRLAGRPSPLYSSADKPTPGADASKLTSYPVVPATTLTPVQVTALETSTGVTGHTRSGGGAKYGFRFMDAGSLKGPEAAELDDAPQLGTANDSEQIFETTALAVEGTQKDTYYGSVNWGWKRDTAGKFSMLPFKTISQGTPSANFLTAASIWNTATEDFNWGVNVATANVLDATDITKTKAAVTKGTALAWGGAQGTAGGVTYKLVTVKDGPSKGTSGLINSTEMVMMDVGRATVDLPVAEVYKSNTAGVWMVSDPAKAATTIVTKLPKDARVMITDAKTNPDWSKIKIVDGPDTNKEGWVKKTLLTKETLGTH